MKQTDCNESPRSRVLQVWSIRTIPSLVAERWTLRRLISLGKALVSIPRRASRRPDQSHSNNGDDDDDEPVWSAEPVSFLEANIRSVRTALAKDWSVMILVKMSALR